MADQWAKADSVLQWIQYEVINNLSCTANAKQNKYCQFYLSMNTWRKNAL